MARTIPKKHADVPSQTSACFSEIIVIFFRYSLLKSAGQDKAYPEEEIAERDGFRFLDAFAAPVNDRERLCKAHFPYGSLGFPEGLVNVFSAIFACFSSGEELPNCIFVGSKKSVERYLSAKIATCAGFPDSFIGVVALFCPSVESAKPLGCVLEERKSEGRKKGRKRRGKVLRELCFLYFANIFNNLN